MSDKSPLFVSALELLAHATELYASEHPRNNKFVILHLANAIELIIKDCLIDHGVSIYKNPNETITIWGGFNELEKLGIVIPEKPIIELLIDDRNTIQHRFGFPNAEAVFYYLEEVVSFFTRFLNEQYKVDLAEALEKHLSSDNLALLGLVKDNYIHFRKLMQISPEAAIQQAFNTVERTIDQLFSSHTSGTVFLRRNRPVSERFILEFLFVLTQRGYLPDDIVTRYQSLRKLRNFVAHGSPIKEEQINWQTELDTAIQILTAIDKAKRDGVIKTSNESYPLRNLVQLSPSLAIELSFYTIREELDRIRTLPSIRSSSVIDTSRGVYLGVLNLLASHGYLSQDIEEKYQLLVNMRKSTSEQNVDADTFFDISEQIVEGISRARIDGFFRKLELEIKEDESRVEKQGVVEIEHVLPQEDS